MNLIQTVAPLSEPLSLASVKNSMRVLEDFDDALILEYIATSREWAEEYTNRQIMTATFELTNEIIYTGFRLPKNPIQSITKIEYMDLNGTYQLMNTDDYYLDNDNGIGKLFINKMPVYKCDKRAFKITFIGGYENEKVPSRFISYIRLTVDTLYKERALITDFKKDDTVKNFYIKMINSLRIIPV